MRLLIIEDDFLLCRSLAATLREENYAVDTAEEGGEGLRKSLAHDYDCIILDGMLPVMNGWELLRALRPKKTTPVLMLTARDAVADRILGLNEGADDYLTKPFDAEELLARIRALIRRSSNLASNLILIGNIAIDTAAKTVTRGDMVIPLTPREYSLIEYLALHRGKVVSRSELYDHLYDEADDTLSNLLDVHVSNLRKKLGAEIITTRRGHGYAIE